MLRLFRLLSTGHARRHALEAILAVLGVAIGVAVVVAVDGAVRASVASFQEAVRSVSGEATHSIEATQGPLRDADYLALAKADLDVPLAPVIDRRLSTSHGSEESRVIRLLGVDPFADGEMRSFTAMRDELSEEDFRRFMTESNCVVIPAALARQLGISHGDEFNVNVGDRLETVTVVGVIEPTGPFADQLRDLVLADLATAQELTDRIDELDRIDVTLLDDAAERRVRSVLPDHLELRSVSDRARKLEGLIAAYRLNLDALSLMASFVALFIVYNAMTVSVEQRLKSLAVLRMLGATRPQLAGLYLFEAMAAAVLGAGLGVLLGWALAAVMVQYVGATISDLYARIRPPAVTLPWASVAKGLGIALISGLLGAVVPLWRASRTPPVSTLRPSLGQRGAERASWWLVSLSVVLLAVSAGLAMWPGGGITGAFAAALLAALGFAGLCPALTRAVAATATAWGKRAQSLPLAMAGASVGHALRLTGVAVAAMMLAMAMNVSLLTMVQSFRDAVLDWLDQRFRSDVFVAPQLLIDHNVEAELDPAVVDWVQQHPETRSILTNRRRSLTLRGHPMHIQATQVDKLLAQNAVPFRHPPPPGQDFDPTQHVLLSEPAAGKTDLSVGDAVTLNTPTGDHTLRVHGIYFDFGSDRGELMMQLATYAELWADPSLNSVHAELVPTADPEAVAADWAQQLNPEFPVVANSYAWIKSETKRIFDRTFRVTDVMGWLAAAVAFCGLAGALLALSLARHRDHSVLAALGMSPAQTDRWLLAEGLILALAASLAAAVAGTVLAHVLAYVIQYRSFGWSIPVRFQPWAWLQVVGYASLAAVLASLYPMWRRRHSGLAAALREE